MRLCVFVSLLATLLPGARGETVRFATFNTSLARRNAGDLIKDLSTPGHTQVRKIAEIIQRVRPDVVLLNEFDHDASGRAAALFQENYLSVGQHGQRPIVYEHRFTAPVNTGVPSSVDLNHDGRDDGPQDAFGFGFHPGQYGMVVYSKYPIDVKAARTFQHLLWKDKPGALLPQMEDGEPYYNPAALDVLRLSSKSHWDLPITFGKRTIHLLCSHPTPPVFDGPEDRNGRRNFDEIGFWADYLEPNRGGYIRDDRGRQGGLSMTASFVLVGDLNADPSDGDSRPNAVNQLLNHPRVNNRIVPASEGAADKANSDGGVNETHRTPAQHDTADFNDSRAGNLRLDYALPSTGLDVVGSGVFWPAANHAGHDLIDASDHRLVWIDVELAE